MHMYAYIYAYILHTYTNVFYKWAIVYSNNKLKLVDFNIKFSCLSIVSVLQSLIHAMHPPGKYQY